MNDNTTYKPGDIENGHILNDAGSWEPVDAPPALEKKSKKHLIGYPVVAVACLVIGSAMAGGGASGTPSAAAPAAAPTVTTEVQVPGPTTTVTAPAPKPAAPAPKPAAPAPTSAVVPETFKMPNLVGQNLQLAQDKLQSLGSFVVDQTDASGLGRFQVNDSNWQVCKQSPAAGKKVPVETVVVLSSVKLGEDCP